MDEDREPTKEEVKELLAKTKQLLEEHEWIQGTSARDKDGKVVASYSKAACSFCLDGALAHMLGPRHGFGLGLAAMEALVESIKEACPIMAKQFENFAYSDAITSFNDTRGRTKQEVLGVIDKAIEKLESSNAG